MDTAESVNARVGCADVAVGAIDRLEDAIAGGNITVVDSAIRQVRTLRVGLAATAAGNLFMATRTALHAARIVRARITIIAILVRHLAR